MTRLPLLALLTALAALLTAPASAQVCFDAFGNRVACGPRYASTAAYSAPTSARTESFRGPLGFWRTRTVHSSAPQSHGSASVSMAYAPQSHGSSAAVQTYTSTPDLTTVTNQPANTTSSAPSSSLERDIQALKSSVEEISSRLRAVEQSTNLYTPDPLSQSSSPKTTLASSKGSSPEKKGSGDLASLAGMVEHNPDCSCGPDCQCGPDCACGETI